MCKVAQNEIAAKRVTDSFFLCPSLQGNRNRLLSIDQHDVVDMQGSYALYKMSSNFINQNFIDRYLDQNRFFSE